jgi:hypothetical protein
MEKYNLRYKDIQVEIAFSPQNLPREEIRGSFRFFLLGKPGLF